MDLANSTIGPALDDVIAGGISFIFGVSGIVIYVLILMVMYRMEIFKESTCYQLLFSLGFADLMALSITTFYVCLGIILQKSLLPYEWETKLLAAASMGFFSTCVHLSTIAINRYICVVPTTGFIGKIAKNWNTKAAIFVSWSLAVIIALPRYTECCPRVLVPSMYKSTPDFSRPEAKLFAKFDMAVVVSSVILGVTCYSFLLLKLRTVSKGSSVSSQDNTGKEVRIAIQTVIVFGAFLLEDLAFNVIPRISRNKWASYSLLLIMEAYYAKNPFIYLIFNQKLRKKVLGGKFGSVNSVSAASFTVPRQSVVVRETSKAFY